jgi:hypothetical protein
VRRFFAFVFSVIAASGESDAPPYLYHSGKASFNILKMAHPEITFEFVKCHS